jgi:hypothetical protein
MFPLTCRFGTFRKCLNWILERRRQTCRRVRYYPDILDGKKVRFAAAFFSTVGAHAHASTLCHSSLIQEIFDCDFQFGGTRRLVKSCVRENQIPDFNELIESLLYSHSKDSQEDDYDSISRLVHIRKGVPTSLTHWRRPPQSYESSHTEECEWWSSFRLRRGA